MSHWRGLEEAQDGQLGVRVWEDDPGVRHGAPLLYRYWERGRDICLTVPSKVTAKPLDMWTCLHLLPLSQDGRGAPFRGTYLEAGDGEAASVI